MQVVHALEDQGETLRRRGLLTRYRVQEDAWGVHPFVGQQVQDLGEPSWTVEKRSFLAQY